MYRMFIYMYIAPGQGQTTPRGSTHFHKQKLSVNLVNSCKFVALNYCNCFAQAIEIELEISKFNVGLKSLLHQGLSEPVFDGDLVYKFKRLGV